MDEYIKREAVLRAYEEVQRRNGPWRFETLIESVPAADVAPVRHGRWIVRNKGMNNWVDCSECGTVGSPHWKWCPVCGARMDGDKDA